MAYKERIDYLLLDIRELEKTVAGMRDAEIYPVSFFSQSFELAHKILTDLHQLEADQLETLTRQMEEHRLRLSAIPAKAPVEQPERVDLPTEKEKEEEIVEVEAEVNALQKERIAEDYRASIPLIEILEKKNLSDFRKAFNLNDRFRFRRELFAGDENRMNEAISELNEIHSYEDSITYLHEKLHWNIEDEAVADFLKLIEKRFL